MEQMHSGIWKLLLFKGNLELFIIHYEWTFINSNACIHYGHKWSLS